MVVVQVLVPKKTTKRQDELLKELGPKPPRIVFSTGSPEAIPQAIAEMGIVLEKPYDPEVLLAALHHKAAPVGLFAKLRETLAGN